MGPEESTPPGRQPSFESRHEELVNRLEAGLQRAGWLRAQLLAQGPAEAQPEESLQPEGTPWGEALGFAWASAAWAALELAQLWVFKKRLGMPRREQEALDLLARAEILTLDEARKLRQACELRNLPSRDPGRIDWTYLCRSAEAEHARLEAWAKLSRDLLAAETAVKATAKGPSRE
jgi:uncharacterized protein YutE (UPF0331/DUF86 family)